MSTTPCTDFSRDCQTRGMTTLPSGTVTFLFTDIEGSTTLWERDRAAMGVAVERHFALVCASIDAHNGVRFKVVGDAVQAAFPTAPDGVAAALETQQGLLREVWPEGIGPMRVRMALHTAAATPQDGDYRAPGLNRLARLLAAAHGGQVLLSLATQDLARDALPPGVTLRDLGEHPLRDLYRPERVFQLLHPDLPVDFPPIRTLATHPNNLPPQQTPFVGREEQIARAFALLSRSDVRLVTITGPGGVGKTRLALQVAADLLDAFPDGAWFVDLSTLADASLVPSAIADALGVREEGGDLSNRLVAMLAGKQLLLVLDNFERVVDAASAVAGLLARAPGVKVLTTSRTPMHTYGEREFPLHPFPMPDLAHLPTIDALTQYEAVRLFVERAQAVRPDFTVTNSNAPAVAEICSRLDGLPLAIELAAACVKVLPPQALLKRLEPRLPLLTRGARDLPARQQTMHNTIAWSHDLLPQEEQTLFRRLSVFSGGCTIAAAESVGTRNGSREVFGGLTSLVDKSLLRHEEGPEGEPRFRMLETVREYGQELLGASGEEEETRRRLAAWCLALAEEAQPDVPGRTLPPSWVARLNEELPNLRAAVTWLLDHGEATRVLRLLAATEDYWTQQHTSNAELRQWLETALADAPHAPPTDRALAHWLLTLMNGVQGHGEAAGVHAQQALIAAQAAGEPHLLGVAQYAVGLAWDFRGDFTRAAAAYAEAIPLLRAAGSDAFVWFAQAVLADKLVMSGDLDEGVAMLDEALMHLRETSADWFVVLAVDHRGHVALLQRDLPGAARWFTETIDLARTLRQTRALLSAVTGLAGVVLTLGEADRAARFLGAVEATRAALGLAQIHNVHHTDRILADAHAALEAPAFERAWAAGHRLSLEEVVGEALTVANEVLAQGKG
jgi:predicted ATPase/class 3 adenylate cyclase